MFPCQTFLIKYLFIKSCSWISRVLQLFLLNIFRKVLWAYRKYVTIDDNILVIHIMNIIKETNSENCVDVGFSLMPSTCQELAKAYTYFIVLWIYFSNIQTNFTVSRGCFYLMDINFQSIVQTRHTFRRKSFPIWHVLTRTLYAQCIFDYRNGINLLELVLFLLRQTYGNRGFAFLQADLIEPTT